MNLVWYRNDLRVHAHRALQQALELGEPVLALLVFGLGVARGGYYSSGPGSRLKRFVIQPCFRGPVTRQSNRKASALSKMSRPE